MFQKLGPKLQQFMIGRNGPDDLARFSLGVAFVWMVLSALFVGTIVNGLLTGLALGFMGYCYFRVLSRNLDARRKENRAYVSIRTRATAPLRKKYSHFKEWKTYHKTHRLFRCKQCDQSLRVPKGKGSVEVTCPKCKTKFNAKT